MKPHFTTFAATILGLIGLGWLIVAVVINQPSWEHLRPFFVAGGVIVLGIAAAIFLLARRTEGAE